MAFRHNGAQACQHNPAQIAAIIRLAVAGDRPFHFSVADEALTLGDFLRAGDLEALTIFEESNEISGVEQAVGRAGVAPGLAAAHDFHVQFAAFQIHLVHVGDFQFSAWGWLESAAISTTCSSQKRGR
jgi:hypothetical protein